MNQSSSTPAKSGLGLLPLLAPASFVRPPNEKLHVHQPGSGMLVWQMLMAGFAGVMFYFRRLTSWFKGKKGPQD